MKNMLNKFLNIILALSSIVFIVACTDENKEAIGSVVREVRINTPTNNSNFTLSGSSYKNEAFSLQYVMADFGYSAAVTHRLQIVKADQEFGSVISGLTLVNENVSNNVSEISFTQKLLNARLIIAGGQFGETSTYKMRVVGAVTDKLYSASNVVTFTANVYNPIDEAEQLFVFGNFGAAAGYADWNINATGTANTPVIYSPKNDGVYQGFVFMNVANPEFKLARIVEGVLEVKTVNLKYDPATQIDVLLGVEDSNPLGTNVTGTLMTSTPDSSGATITPPGTTNLAGPYYLIVDWNTNRYVMAKRAMSIAGPPPNQVARPLTYVSDTSSPYFGKYVNTNATVSAGQIYVQLRNNSSATTSRVERLMSTNSTVSQILLSSSSDINPNKLKFGGTNIQIIQPGSYTFVLDLMNALDYNLIAIKN